jgi:hypothetical protein
VRILSRLRTTPRARRSSIAVALLAVVVLVIVIVLPSSTTAQVSPRCAPATLNVSAAVAGGRVTVTPGPGARDASYRTQISFLGAPAADVSGVSVTGARSGRHGGRLVAYSQGDGASFLPSRSFSQGEAVTVRAVLRRGGRTIPFAWDFTVAALDSVSRSLETPPPPPPPPKASELQRFLSRPELKPPVVDVTTDTGSRSPGDVFLAPYAGPGQYGPMILDGDGGLLWFKAVPHGARAADLRVQEYDGQKVLTWWQSPLVSGGRHDSGVVIADSTYRNLAIVRAGNGYQPDLHAFQITPAGTALFTVYDAIRCDLRAYGGPADGAVADTLVQEVDLKTGLVRYEWHSLDHVALEDSYMPVKPGTAKSPWDFFHINAVTEHGGRLLVDSRNTWAAYDIDARSGRIVWRVGGKHSSFRMPRSARPAWQHDARQEPDGAISFFDNGATPVVHPQSRVIVLRLDERHMTASLVSSFHHHPKPLIAPSQGDFQPLPGGDWLVGWGQEPYLSELDAAGNELLDAHLPAKYQSYTVLKFPWVGTPTQPPRLAVRPRAGGGLDAYASWNGATEVARWQLLGGASPQKLTPLGTAVRSSFETKLAVSSTQPYLAVRALGANGQVLGTSVTAHT